ncbi:MAG: hypothetical protein J6U54_13820 [Clostridiales bacterium]|nr:hypothetical protein [Clostridiales bacterium]
MNDKLKLMDLLEKYAERRDSIIRVAACLMVGSFVCFINSRVGNVVVFDLLTALFSTLAMFSCGIVFGVCMCMKHLKEIINSLPDTDDSDNA